MVLVGALSPSVAPAGAARAASARATRPVPSGPLALPGLPRSAAYVRQLYVAVAGREPTSDEVRVVGTGLDAGLAPAVVVEALARSDDFLLPRLDHLYRQLLDRPANATGARFWADRLRTPPWSIERVVTALVGSPEFLAAAGGTPAGFVTLAYERLFGHGPDAAGRDHWAALVAGGRPRTAVASALVRTSGYAVPLIRLLFRRALDRPADPSGLAHFDDLFVTRRFGEVQILAALLGGRESANAGCDFLVGRSCLLPFPNDYFTVPDSTTATGRRVAFKQSFMPANAGGTRVDPTEWNRNDGFSPGAAILVQVPGLDLNSTGAAPLTDIGRSLDTAAPILVVDADTGEQQPVFVELDANIPADQRAANQLLYIRPAKNWQEGHRYIVVLRNLRDTSGAPLAVPDAFRRYRDDLPSGIAGFERRRPHMESLFSELSDAGVARNDLYLAWDFTVASANNVSGRMRSIRDDALSRLGTTAPPFTVDTVTANPAPGVVRRVDGTFDVPLYLTGNGSPGNFFTARPDGRPAVNGSITAHYTCLIPNTALTSPARGVVYGHGLFGGRDEVNSGSQVAMVANHNMVYCATDWLGMAEEDISNAAVILGDLSKFKSMVDRSQQGILDTIFLARLLKRADGFGSNPAFRNSSAQSVLDPSSVFYDGNSQGAVIGGALVAMSPDISHGVLGVAGMNYSTLLERSVDFDPFNALFRPSYPDPVERVIGLGLIQMLWDRGETNGYAAHMTSDPLPGTGPHRVLLHVALGDHQVATLSAEVEARTAGLSVHTPAYGPGRSLDVAPAWGIPSITSYPFAGSALFVYDSGAAVPPAQNTPPRAGFDPHEDPRRRRARSTTEVRLPQGRRRRQRRLRPGGLHRHPLTHAGAAATDPNRRGRRPRRLRRPVRRWAGRPRPARGARAGVGRHRRRPVAVVGGQPGRWAGADSGGAPGLRR